MHFEMAFDENLAERVRLIFAGRPDVAERRMFGGLAFMVRGHMCVGISGTKLMARVGPAAYEEALAQPHARHMDFTSKPLRGYVYVLADGLTDDASLHGWVAACERFVATLPAK